jgi:hypothetical protein
MRSHFQKSAHIREVLLKDTYYVSELLEGWYYEPKVGEHWLEEFQELALHLVAMNLQNEV